MLSKIFQWFSGRHTFFALFFTIFGSILAWHRSLDMPYVALVTAIQGWVFAHSVKEDRFNSGPEQPDVK